MFQKIFLKHQKARKLGTQNETLNPWRPDIILGSLFDYISSLYLKDFSLFKLRYINY
jgi:hypothetical protein